MSGNSGSPEFTEILMNHSPLSISINSPDKITRLRRLGTRIGMLPQQ